MYAMTAFIEEYKDSSHSRMQRLQSVKNANWVEHPTCLMDVVGLNPA